MRVKSALSRPASVRTRSVLPSPGGPSSRTCPPASRATIKSRTGSSCPFTTVSRPCIIETAASRTLCTSTEHLLFETVDLLRPREHLTVPEALLEQSLLGRVQDAGHALFAGALEGAERARDLIDRGALRQSASRARFPAEPMQHPFDRMAPRAAPAVERGHRPDELETGAAKRLRRCARRSEADPPRRAVQRRHGEGLQPGPHESPSLETPDRREQPPVAVVVLVEAYGSSVAQIFDEAQRELEVVPLEKAIVRKQRTENPHHASRAECPFRGDHLPRRTERKRRSQRLFQEPPVRMEHEALQVRSRRLRGGPAGGHRLRAGGHEGQPIGLGQGRAAREAGLVEETVELP